ncbi:MAG: hypothetical protein ACRDMA_17855, partial [Solirubrobacterales bacterium]
RCPACGAPLYGWVVVGAADPADATSYVVDRCEECGLGVSRDLPFDDSAWRPDPGGTLEFRAPNRASWQAGLGGDRWAALELPAQRLHLTPRSLELLLPRLGLETVRVRQPAFGRSQLWMWQTLLNGFTFHTNFATRVLGGRLAPRTARNLPSFVVDAAVSALAALPLAVIAVALELVATLARRGGELVVSVGRAGS